MPRTKTENINERRVGIRELKSGLSKYVREVKTGKTIVVTERGRPVARIIPQVASVQERLEALTKAGLLIWNGRKLGPFKPVGRIRGTRTLADIVSENRG